MNVLYFGDSVYGFSMSAPSPLHSSSHRGRKLRFLASDRPPVMYGPPPFCKRRMRLAEMVCAHVYGL